MPDAKPYFGPTKLIIAFDIGTTYSGISYCILEQGQVPEILGVTRFPAQEPVSRDAKVPSLLYYDKSGNVKAAGAEVLTEQVTWTALDEGWQRAEWWKLHLRPKHLASSIGSDNDLPPLPSGKSAVGVLRDFIAYLFQCVKTYVEEQHPGFDWSSGKDSMEFIFTHPNGWEGLQQQQYRLAIEHAGLVPSTPEGRSRVHMLTEGEASLHFCVTTLVTPRETDLSFPEGVVIIDAGGGIIDLSMFTMRFNPISCSEIAPAECRLQGSVFVTRRARKLLARKLDGWDHSSSEEIADYTREFDQTTKLGIKSVDEPAYITVAGPRTTIPKYGITFGKLKLSGTEATGLFDESVDAVVDAFEQQLKFASAKITTAFLLGGLSTNAWFCSCLRSYFQERGIETYRPDNHINVVAHGAVLFQLDHLFELQVRVARMTYGVVCALPVQENNPDHLRRKPSWFRDPSGNLHVSGYFEAMLYKGGHVRKETEFRQSFVLRGRSPEDFGMQKLRIICYRGNLSHPQWVDEDPSFFCTFYTICADLSKAMTGLVKRKALDKVFYELDYDVILLLGYTEMQAQLAWKTREGEQRQVTASPLVSHLMQSRMPAMTLFESDKDQETPASLSQSCGTQPQVSSCSSKEIDGKIHLHVAPLDLTASIIKPKEQYSEGGAFGDVYQCRYNCPTGPIEVAVKSFRFKFTLQADDDADHAAKMVRRELGIWRRLDHPNIVPFLGVATGFGMEASLALVSVWMPNGSLQTFLENHGERLHLAHRLRLLWDVANGLDYLHSLPETPIVHGDLNGNNVLVDGNFVARLVDFGYSTVVGSIPQALAYLQRSTARPGATRWGAPELILVEDDEIPERTPKSDIYSFGCLCLQILTGKQPWSEVREEAAIVLRMSKGQKPKRPQSRVMEDWHWEFIRRCWAPIEERPTASKLAYNLQEFLSRCPQSPSLRDMFSSPPS